MVTTMPDAAADSLRGLALGDGFGERWFFRGNSEAIAMIRARHIPEESPWHWTDDTAMALAIVHVLRDRGEIEPAELAAAFAANYAADPMCWSDHARELFDGQGSLGDGAAMRVAPLGAWFDGDLDRACAQARVSAQVTHAHPEGIAGAVAVAAAAALAAATRTTIAPDPPGFLRAVAVRTPAGPVRDGITAAAGLGHGTAPWRAADVLGNGQHISAADTVPFALWSAAHHLEDLADALWTTAEGLGDVDTTCAITAGVVSARTGLSGVPRRWLELSEPLPDWVHGS